MWNLEFFAGPNLITIGTKAVGIWNWQLLKVFIPKVRTIG